MCIKNKKYWNNIISELPGLPEDPFIDGFDEEIVRDDVLEYTNGILELDLYAEINDNGFTLYDGNNIIGVIIFNKDDKNHIDFVGSINGDIEDLDDDKYKNFFIDIFYGIDKSKYKGIPGLGKKLFELYFKELDSGTNIELTSLETSFGFYLKIFTEFENNGIIEIVKSGTQDFTIKIL